MQAKQPTPVRLYTLMCHCGTWGYNFITTTSDRVLTDDDAYIDTWRAKLGLVERARCIELVQGGYQVPPKKDTTYWRLYNPSGHYTYEIANSAVKYAAVECPEGAPYGLAFLGMNDSDPGRIKVRDDIVADWRASFAKPAPTLTPIQGYLEACRVVEAANAAKEAALAKIKQVADATVCDGFPAPVKVTDEWLDAVLKAARNEPATVFRMVPKRLAALKKLGFEVEVLFTVPKTNVLQAYDRVVKDATTEDSYARLRVPA